jgi:hypothetical protein
VDRENQLLWHARRQRLDGEAIRDAMLSLSGELNLRAFGPSARPQLPAGISNYAWKPDIRPEGQHRRSVYVLAKRNLRYPLFDSFDLPDMHNSCARRIRTTTAPQALLLLNGEFSIDRARHWANQLLRRHAADNRRLVTQAYRAAWGRQATAEDMASGLRFLKMQAAASPLAGTHAGQSPGCPADGGDTAWTAAVEDFCHALLNANEFLYID